LVKLLNVILPPLINLLQKPVIAALVGLANVLTKTVVPAISWLTDKAIPGLNSAIGSIQRNIKSLVPHLLSLGKQLIGGLWDGMRTVMDNLLNWLKARAKSILGILGGILHTLTGGLLGSSGGSPSGAPAANAALARKMVPQW